MLHFVGSQAGVFLFRSISPETITRDLFYNQRMSYVQ